jgi:hypothetical protein
MEVFSRRNISVTLTVIFLTVFISLHIDIISKTLRIDSDRSMYTTFEGYGDVPIHLSQITKFAYESSFSNLNEPLFYGNLVQYHFLINFIRGMVFKLTGNLLFSFLWPLYVLAAANIILVFLIYKKILEKNSWSIAALLIFFLGAGLTAWRTIISYESRTTFFLYAKYPDQPTVFGSPMTSAFTVQQSFFIGMFLFLVLIWFLLYLRDKDSHKAIIVAGLAYGWLPLAHTHAFVAASAVLFVSLILNLGKKTRAYLVKLISITAIGVIVAVPQLVFLMATKKAVGTHSDFAMFRFGWMVQPAPGSINFASIESVSPWSWEYVHFLFVNFGAILPLVILATTLLIIYYRKIKKENAYPVIVFGITAALLFLSVQFIKFQPWDFDDNKILNYFLFFFAPFLIWLVLYFFRNYRRLRGGAVIVVLLLTIPTGVIDLAYHVAYPRNQLLRIFSAESSAVADYTIANIREEDLVLSSTTFMNPVMSLAGRPA